MSDENFTGVRATTADEEAVMFQQSWIKAERENAALREENARLRQLNCNLIRQDECDELREENARLRAALEFYADSKNYSEIETGIGMLDGMSERDCCGRRAREALGMEE